MPGISLRCTIYVRLYNPKYILLTWGISSPQDLLEPILRSVIRGLAAIYSGNHDNNISHLKNVLTGLLCEIDPPVHGPVSAWRVASGQAQDGRKKMLRSFLAVRKGDCISYIMCVCSCARVINRSSYDRLWSHETSLPEVTRLGTFICIIFCEE